MSDSMNKQATIERLRLQLAQAEADRDVLAAEVRELRKQRVHKVTLTAMRAGNATDTSGALDRAKEQP